MWEKSCGPLVKKCGYSWSCVINFQLIQYVYIMDLMSHIYPLIILWAVLLTCSYSSPLVSKSTPKVQYSQKGVMYLCNTIFHLLHLFLLNYEAITCFTKLLGLNRNPVDKAKDPTYLVSCDPQTAFRKPTCKRKKASPPLLYCYWYSETFCHGTSGCFIKYEYLCATTHYQEVHLDFGNHQNLIQESNGQSPFISPKPQPRQQK